MGKANGLTRDRPDGGLIHVTHRRHNRELLLRFGCNRELYRAKLREHLRRHPREWERVGYHQILGKRRRYRLIDLERLCWRLGTDNLQDVRQNLKASLAEQIARGNLRRQPRWTESLAVGSAAFLEKVKPLMLSRVETEVVETAEGV